MKPPRAWTCRRWRVPDVIGAGGVRARLALGVQPAGSRQRFQPRERDALQPALPRMPVLSNSSRQSLCRKVSPERAMGQVGGAYVTRPGSLVHQGGAINMSTASVGRRRGGPIVDAGRDTGVRRSSSLCPALPGVELSPVKRGPVLRNERPDLGLRCSALVRSLRAMGVSLGPLPARDPKPRSAPRR